MKILMVCLGNICRSPLAEGILQSKINEKHKVDSAGTGAWHVGELPDRRSINTAKAHGIDITNQRARKFQKSDFQEFDIIYVMDSSNYSDILSLTDNEEEAQKVKMILSENSSSKDLDVPDPYYGGDLGFEKVYQLLDEVTDLIVEKYNLK